MENLMIERIHTLRLWVRARQHAAVQLICLVVVFITYRRLQKKYHFNLPTREVLLHRQRVRKEILNELSTSGKYREIIRVSEAAFLKLCKVLERYGGLRPTQRMSIEEQVARFMHIAGNDTRNRLTSLCYRRSYSTTSRSFHRVLRAVIAIEEHYLHQPTGQSIPKEIHEKKRFYPFFKDCVGAIDGTHIRVRVSSKDAPRYYLKCTYCLFDQFPFLYAMES